MSGPGFERISRGRSIPASLTRRRLLEGSIAALASPFVATAGWANSEWPSRAVRVVVPYPPGGGADTTARILFQKLGEVWGKSFVIDNKAGAGGTLAEAAVAKSDADGYTIMHDATGHSINPGLYPNLSFNAEKDFAPVFLATLVPNVLVVNKEVAENTLADVTAAAKAAPGGLQFASSGIGTVQHLCLEMFKSLAQVPVIHVPYRGGGPALNDVMGGHIRYFFSNGAASVGMVEAGQIKAICHTGKGKLNTLADLPAAQDSLPGLEAYEWNGVFAPAKTPPEIVQKLNAGLNQLLREADIRERFKTLNIDYKENTPEEFRAFVADETKKWAATLKTVTL